MHCCQPFLVLDAQVIWCLILGSELSHLVEAVLVLSRSTSNRKQAYYRNSRALLQTFLLDFLDSAVPTVAKSDHFCHPSHFHFISIAVPFPFHSISTSSLATFLKFMYRLHLILYQCNVASLLVVGRMGKSPLRTFAFNRKRTSNF